MLLQPPGLQTYPSLFSCLLQLQPDYCLLSWPSFLSCLLQSQTRPSFFSCLLELQFPFLVSASFSSFLAFCSLLVCRLILLSFIVFFSLLLCLQTRPSFFSCLLELQFPCQLPFPCLSMSLLSAASRFADLSFFLFLSSSASSLLSVFLACFPLPSSVSLSACRLVLLSFLAFLSFSFLFCFLVLLFLLSAASWSADLSFCLFLSSSASASLSASLAFFPFLSSLISLSVCRPVLLSFRVFWIPLKVS